MAAINWRKTMLFSLLALALALLLTACSVGAKQQAVYDDDSQIVQAGDSYSFSQRIETVEGQTLTIEYQRFYGVQSIWTIDAASGQKLRIGFVSAVKRGSFKLVLVLPDDQLLLLLEQGGQGVVELDISPGRHALKIVGHKAAGRIELQLEPGGRAPTFVHDRGEERDLRADEGRGGPRSRQTGCPAVLWGSLFQRFMGFAGNPNCQTRGSL